LPLSVHADVFDDVPEAADYEVLYSIDLSVTGNYAAQPVVYDVDNRADWAAPFNRVAYYLRLQRPDEDAYFVYVSGDAFTQDGLDLGLPIFGTELVIQRRFENLTVQSNMPPRSVPPARRGAVRPARRAEADQRPEPAGLPT